MAKARPTSTDIDRFLEEVNRRKQQQAKQSAAPPPVQRAPKPAPPPPAPKPVRVQQKQVLVAEPIVRTIVLEAEPEPVTPLREYVTKATYQPPAAQLPPRQPDSATVQKVKGLLHSKEGLRAMFVMNEILAPPRCKRPFRR